MKTNLVLKYNWIKRNVSFLYWEKKWQKPFCSSEENACVSVPFLLSILKTKLFCLSRHEDGLLNKSPLFNTHVTSALSMRLWKDFNVSISSALLPVNYDVQMPLENFHFIKIWVGNDREEYTPKVTLINTSSMSFWRICKSFCFTSLFFWVLAGCMKACICWKIST